MRFLLLLNLILASNSYAHGETDCRLEVVGLPFRIPAAMAESYHDDRIYFPKGVEGATPVLDWLPKYFAGGKRLRPLMVYLSALTMGMESKSVEPLAAMVEWIHTGSLALDDIIDESVERRGQDPLYIGQGRIAGLITGPWLQAYVQGFAEDVTTPAVRRRLSQVLRDMGDGEILQDRLKQRARRTQIYTAEEYARVANGKTGALFGFSAEIVALHSDAPAELIATWRRLGELLGITYQMRDDFKDAGAEPYEVNYALLRYAERTHGPAFGLTLQEGHLKALTELEAPFFEARRGELLALVDRIENAVAPQAVPQREALQSLREMADFVSRF